MSDDALEMLAECETELDPCMTNREYDDAFGPSGWTAELIASYEDYLERIGDPNAPSQINPF